jgi:serine/threonine-protein kinase
MSPEQCRSSGQIDQRADIYSLGCILFELITGRTPFDGDLRQLIERHQRATPPRAKSFAPEISAALDELIARMLEKDPAARPQTMGAVQRELQQVGGASIGVAATMLPMAAHLVGLGLPVPQGSGPRVFDPGDSGAEILVPAQILAAAGPAPRPRAPRKSRTGAIVATAVAFLVAALVTAVVMRDGEAAGPTTARPVPAAITTSSLP